MRVLGASLGCMKGNTVKAIHQWRVPLAALVGAIGASAVLCLAPAQQPASGDPSTRTSNVVQARAFRVVDEGGTERGFLGLAEDETVSLRLGLDARKPLAEVAVKKSGEAAVTVVSANGRAQVLLACGPRGDMDSMFFVSLQEQGNIALSATQAGGLRMNFTDKKLRTRAALQLAPDGQISFSLFDRDGKPLDPGGRGH